MPWAESVRNLALKVQILSLCSRGGGGVVTLAAATNKRYVGLWHNCSGAALSPGAKCSVFRMRLTARERQREVRNLSLTLLVFHWVYLCVLIFYFFWCEGVSAWLISCVCICVSACLCVNEEEGEKSLGCQDAVWGVKDSPVIYKTLGDSSPFLSSSSLLLQTPLHSSLPLWDPQCWEEMCH